MMIVDAMAVALIPYPSMMCTRHLYSHKVPRVPQSACPESSNFVSMEIKVALR